MRLIDADRLLERLKNPDLCNVTQKVFEIIDEQPTVESLNDVKHGEWISYDKLYNESEATWETIWECYKTEGIIDFNYSNCGQALSWEYSDGNKENKEEC